MVIIKKKNIMKKILSLALIGVLFCSCNKNNDVPKSPQTAKAYYEVTTSDPQHFDVKVHLKKMNQLDINNYDEQEHNVSSPYKSNILDIKSGDFLLLSAEEVKKDSTEQPTPTIAIKLYVNNQLEASTEGNGYQIINYTFDSLAK